MTPTTYGDPALWVVVWGVRLERKSFFDDKPLADAYAAAHHGVVVGLMPVGEWPRLPDPAQLPA